mgnify:CR=1 FL=1
MSTMAQEHYPASLDADIRIDYALIITGVAAALVAFIYLIIV